MKGELLEANEEESSSWRLSETLPMAVVAELQDNERSLREQK